MAVSASAPRPAYWFCQAAGWAGFWLTQFYSFQALGVDRPGVGWMLLLLAAVGFGLTHLYRSVLVRTGVLAWPAQQQVGVAVGAMLLISLAIHLTGSLWAGLTTGQWAFGDPARLWLSITNGIRYLAVWFLAYHFFAAGQRLTAVEVRHLRTEAALRQAELDTLRAQVNPHFLFNALNSIRALTLSDPHGARTAVTQLADLLRYSLRYGQQPVVALREELAAVQDYLALEQTRFGPDRLRVDLDVPPAALGWPVPPAALLTLVENAVKHGIATFPAGGELRVCATPVPPDRLLLEVRQPGHLPAQPVPADGLTTASLPALPTSATGGLGLLNTRQRLAVLYGPAAWLTLAETPAGVVVAGLHLPATPTYSVR